MFGKLIHELTGPMIPTVLPGVHGVHAVDAAGVHPLLLAIGSERYTPFLDAAAPQELLTQASAILGQGQLSLAKFLLIVARHDDPQLDVHDIAAFLRHVLERADWRRDLHFHTHTTIDTLDYSGAGLNAGSKVVIAAAGPKRFELATDAAGEPARCPTASAIRASCCPACSPSKARRARKPSFDYDDSVRARVAVARAKSPAPCGASATTLDAAHPLNHFRLIVVVDDSQFVAESLSNFLWVDVHPHQPGRRHLRHRRVHQRKALGLPRRPGDRRPHQAAPRAGARRRPRNHPPRRRPRRPGRPAARDHLRSP